ncbi:MAG TPA: hypothetical protein VMF90_01855 [Rhizobiaceae bacterium]|nr:hypothetical protein [Rhizobiaceae bacterium]
MQQPAFDSTMVQKFTSDAATEWMEYSGFSLADVVNEDEHPDAKLGALGFTRSRKGATSQFEFAYDEVLVVTKGSCTVRSGGQTLTAKLGETLYLPAGVPGEIRADEDLEIVYVASSPYGEVNRAAKAELLGKN